MTALSIVRFGVATAATSASERAPTLGCPKRTILCCVWALGTFATADRQCGHYCRQHARKRLRGQW